MEDGHRCPEDRRGWAAGGDLGQAFLVAAFRHGKHLTLPQEKIMAEIPSAFLFSLAFLQSVFSMLLLPDPRLLWATIRRPARPTRAVLRNMKLKSGRRTDGRRSKDGRRKIKRNGSLRSTFFSWVLASRNIILMAINN